MPEFPRPALYLVDGLRMRCLNLGRSVQAVFLEFGLAGDDDLLLQWLFCELGIDDRRPPNLSEVSVNSIKFKIGPGLKDPHVVDQVQGVARGIKLAGFEVGKGFGRASPGVIADMPAR